MKHFLLFKTTLLAFVFCQFNANVFSQDFYQSYKNDFLDPYQKVASTPTKDDDKVFFQEQIKKLGAYNPPSLQRFIAKQIVTLAEPDIETQSESLDAGWTLARKNWLRGKDKIELLKKLDKIAESYQNVIKYNKKNEKLEVYKTSYLIELEIIEEFLAMLKNEDAKFYLQKLEHTFDNVKDQKIISTFDTEIARLKAKIVGCKSLNQSIANLKTQETSPTYKKRMAYDCLIFLFSPESALTYLDGANAPDETAMISAFAKLLNKNSKMAKAPFYFSERDLSLPPIILFERLAHIKEIQVTANFAKEKFEAGDFQFFHHARDIVRELLNRYPDEPSYDEKALINFLNWIETLLKDESEDSQLFFYYQLKTKLAELKPEIPEQQLLNAITAKESFLTDKISTLEKKLKIIKTKVYYSVTAQEEENEKEKQWLAKPQHERRQIIESMQEKVKRANPSADRNNFWIDLNSLTLNIPNDSQLENLSPLKEIPLKNVNINHCNHINDFSFLKDSPVVSIDASWCPSIKSLAPLKNLKTLRNLNLAGVKLYDISDLKGLNLTSLNIGHTSVKDLSPLKSMPLTDLNIERTNVVSLAPIDLMPLVNLNANDCKLLKDIDALENTKIRILRLNGCEAVTSLDCLSKQRLTELYIEETNISDLSPISKSMLTHFYFSKCLKIRSIGEISMMNIENLGINNHLLISTVLKYEFPLKSLRLNSTAIQDLTPLKDFLNLETLDISECDSIRDLRTLKNPSLVNLIAHGCKSLKTYQGISDLSIKNVYANNTELKDLTSLAGSKVEKLEMRDSELFSLKGIAQTSVKDIDVRGSKKLRDISDLENSSVETLWIGGTMPKSADVLKKMKNLKFTDFR